MCQEIRNYHQCGGYDAPCQVKKYNDKKESECYESCIQAIGFGGCGKEIEPIDNEVGRFTCDTCLAKKDLARACVAAKIAGKKQKTYIDQLPEEKR